MKLAKAYQPELYESDIYALWEKLESFKPAQHGDPYSLVVPPPNANGNLHMGHALAFALQDIAARYQRSIGKSVLFIPGADHAGFETQVVFERELEKKGKSRFDYSRESLYQQIYDFVDNNRDNFATQIRRLGASVYWPSYTFTLDKEIVRLAYDTFRKMWQDSLIYRGERLVNFCTFHGTAFADIEVEYREEKGTLWQIKYPLTDGSGSIVVATTRPETMLGDTAVAVHPQDSRYKDIVGKTVRLPLTNRDIPIIADDYVDRNFGTGAVKITPAHDINDYDVGKRHDLPFITVIGFDGRLTHAVPERFRGLTVVEGREAIVKELTKLGLQVGATEHIHSVGHCYKCSTVIEPLLKEQWFVNIKPLAEPAIAELKKGSINFLPLVKRKQLERYLETIRDWNISRQIAWGIPIPAFQNEEDPDDWIYDERVDQETITVNHKIYRRDPDVFDTWFSSSSWPYATLDYPDGNNYKRYYPLSLMETGFDILMPWVSRMLMLGLYITGQIPFRTVYLHGLVTDKHGLKMSKSKGNVVNPMSVIDKFGSDSLRIGMISGQTPGNNQPYIEAKVIGGRNFCNKLWNIARFVESLVDDFNNRTEAKTETDADHWILLGYSKLLETYVSLMDSYRFSEAFENLYHFIWDDFADWYIEASKVSPNPPLLAALLEAVLVLAHPFAPFLAETIWQTLELSPESVLSSRQLIRLKTADNHKANNFNHIKDLIISVRSTIKAVGAKDVVLYIRNIHSTPENNDVIKRLSQLKSVESTEEGRGIAVSGTSIDCWLDIDQKLIDNYLRTLDIKIAETRTNIDRLQTRLNNKNYVDRAPAELVNQSRSQLVEAEQEMENLLLEKQRYKS